MSSACQCHVEGAFCFYCEVYSPVVAENERLRAALERMDDRKHGMIPRSVMARIAKEALDYGTTQESAA
ncbi:hypothetical protein BJP46_15730 [Paenibacillus odorifer]|nr:hypothetical protein BJP46_15730 [Paenibacillus odorifer]